MSTNTNMKTRAETERQRTLVGGTRTSLNRRDAGVSTQQTASRPSHVSQRTASSSRQKEQRESSGQTWSRHSLPSPHRNNSPVRLGNARVEEDAQALSVDLQAAMDRPHHNNRHAVNNFHREHKGRHHPRRHRENSSSSTNNLQCHQEQALGHNKDLTPNHRPEDERMIHMHTHTYTHK